MADKQFIMAIATLVGTIIGAGVLGIPYAISKSGFIPGMIILVILGFAVLILNLCVGEVALRTKGRHQLPGYAEKYLGKWGKHVMSFSIIFAIYGALIAYFIGSGNVLADIFNLGNWSFLFLGLEISASLMFSLILKDPARALSFIPLVMIDPIIRKEIRENCTVEIFFR